MELRILDSALEIAKEAALILQEELKKKKDIRIALPTGTTAEYLYSEIIKLNLDFSQVTTFNLDEYIGIDRGHPCSYFSFMHDHFFSHINIDPKNINCPNGEARDLDEEAERYGQLVSDGGIDLCFLGLGVNGHIGFNEPNAESTSESLTRVIKLHEITREENKKHFPKGVNVPRHAITMGICNIMSAKKCVLMAFGSKKAPIVAATFGSKFNKSIPASNLLHHSNCIVFIDANAAVLLPKLS